ncbi:ATP-binding protein [Corallococcus sp. M34]|uniref:AAA family ATPase n=1 Tax=Citreicoccus inhibens TaxID=2849499 RepID=UPI001C2168D0|nr:AAA family ATPase [Citreicoccus inhibens]MBU8893983.1 ATP-binding protein [Citreicoccus inhibens]
MRIAVSGTHRVGKSTLVDELSELLPTHVSVEEPYAQMEEEGYAFALPPTVEDFEAQLARSLNDVAEAGPDVVFDRCPVDFLGYALAHEDADAFALESWLPRVREALQTLDLVVLVGIEAPDRIRLPASEKAPRRAVDEKMKELLLEDPYGFGVEVLEVEGAPMERAKQVLAHLGTRRSLNAPSTTRR